MARPKKKVDPLRVAQLAANMATQEEIAADQGCSVDTLSRRFADEIKRGHELAKLCLRARQFQLAMGVPAQPAEYLRTGTDEKGRPIGELVRDKDGNPIKVKSETKGFAPNCTMLIWLGKQHLGQSDKFQLGDGDGFEFVS